MNPLRVRFLFGRGFFRRSGSQGDLCFISGHLGFRLANTISWHNSAQFRLKAWSCSDKDKLLLGGANNLELSPIIFDRNSGFKIYQCKCNEWMLTQHQRVKKLKSKCLNQTFLPGALDHSCFIINFVPCLCQIFDNNLIETPVLEMSETKVSWLFCIGSLVSKTE